MGRSRSCGGRLVSLPPLRRSSGGSGRLVETHSTILPSLKKVLLALLAPPTPIRTCTPGRLYGAKGNRGAPILTLKVSPRGGEEKSTRFKVRLGQ
jgi:hypothetical protein